MFNRLDVKRYLLPLVLLISGIAFGQTNVAPVRPRFVPIVLTSSLLDMTSTPGTVGGCVIRTPSDESAAKNMSVLTKAAVYDGHPVTLILIYHPADLAGLEVHLRCPVVK